MKTTEPLTNEEGEIRELTAEDLAEFRPIREVLPPEMLQALGVEPLLSEKAGAPPSPLQLATSHALNN